jgi:hypothetical protein
MDDMSLTTTLTPEEIEACEGILAGYSPLIAYRKATGDPSRRGAVKFQKHPEAQVYLAVRRMEIRSKKGLTEADWVDQVSAIAYLDIAEIAANPPGRPQDLVELPKHVRMCIQGWKWDSNGNFIVEFVSKKAAMDMLAKFMGVYQKDRTNAQDVPSDLLRAAFWKYVISMHIGTGVTVAEAIMDAKNNPDEVEKWAAAQGLLKAGEIVV